MEKQVIPLAFREEPEEVQRVFLENVFVLDVQAAVIDPEIGCGRKLGSLLQGSVPTKSLSVGTVLSCLSSRQEQQVRVRPPTSLATRK